MSKKIKAILVLIIGLAIGTTASLAMASEKVSSPAAPKYIFTYDSQNTENLFQIVVYGISSRSISYAVPPAMYSFLRDAQITKMQKSIESGSIFIIDSSLAEELISLLPAADIKIRELSLKNSDLKDALMQIDELGLTKLDPKLEDPTLETIIEKKLLDIVKTKTETHQKPEQIGGDQTFFGFDIGTEQYGEIKIPKYMTKLFQQCLASCDIKSYEYKQTLLFPDINATLSSLKAIAYIFENNTLKWSPLKEPSNIINKEIKQKVWDYVTKKIKEELQGEIIGHHLLLKKDSSQDIYWIITDDAFHKCFFTDVDILTAIKDIKKSTKVEGPIDNPLASIYFFSGKDKQEQGDILNESRVSWRKLEAPDPKKFGVFHESFMGSLSNQMLFRLALGLNVDASYNEIENKLKELTKRLKHENLELAREKIKNLKSKLKEKKVKLEKYKQKKQKLAETNFFDDIYENTKNMLLRTSCVMIASTWGTLAWAGLCKKENAYAGSLCASIITHELCKEPAQALQGVVYLTMPTILGSYLGYQLAQKIMPRFLGKA